MMPTTHSQPYHGAEARGRIPAEVQSTGMSRETALVLGASVRESDRNESLCHKSIAQTKRFQARSTNQRALIEMRELGCWSIADP